MPRLKYSSSIASMCLAFAAASVAHATYTVTFTQMGNDVVATGAGSLDFAVNSRSTGPSPAPVVDPRHVGITVGSAETVDAYAVETEGSANVGFGLAATPTSTSGSFVGFFGNGTASTIDVPAGYVFGTDLGTSTDTFANQTFDTLGLREGTTDYLLNGNDHFTIVVPEPTSLGLLALGSLGLLSRRHRA